MSHLHKIQISLNVIGNHTKWYLTTPSLKIKIQYHNQHSDIATVKI